MEQHHFIDPIREPDESASMLDRLKYLVELSHKSQARFAAMIKLDPSSMSRLLSGKLAITEQFINRIIANLGVSRDWFVNGVGVPFPKNDHLTNLGDGERVLVYPEPKGAPVYDIDATAGPVPVSNMFTRDNILGYIDLPEVNAKNPIIRVTGDSMTPRIPNGSFVSIRQISDPSVIVWGSTYLVQLEDYCLVKIVKPCPHDPSKVVLHSLNSSYDDIEVSRDAIIKLFLVEVVLNYEFLA